MRSVKRKENKDLFIQKLSEEVQALKSTNNRVKRAKRKVLAP